MDLLELIKIAAAIALVMFIILAVIAMASFRSIIRIVNDSLKSFDKFKSDFDRNLNSMSENINELKNKVIGTLDNFDGAVKKLSQNSEDISELKDKVVESLGSFDSLTNSLVRNSEDFSELKTKLVYSLGKVDKLSEQAAASAKHIEENAGEVLDSIKPVAGIVRIVTDKITPPVNFTASLISASTKALKTFLTFVSRKDDAKISPPVSVNLRTSSDEIIVEPVEFDGSPDLFETSNKLMSDENIIDFHMEKYDDSSRASDSFIVSEIPEPDYIFANDSESLEYIDNANVELEAILGDAEKELLENKDISADDKEALKKKIEELRSDARKSSDSVKEMYKG